MAETKEKQYQRAVELRDTHGATRLGIATNQTWRDDPKRLVFMLARYKFAAKMFAGMTHVLEVGCGDAFGTRIMAQEVPHVTAVDFDPLFIDEAQKLMGDTLRFDCRVHDMLAGPVPPGSFDGAYALDVIEHIAASDEQTFLGNIAASLAPHGAMLIGTPSLESQPYASPSSRQGHINCKRGAELKSIVAKFYHRVFLFSMNDEVVHTGFAPMAHYLLALGVCKK